MVDLIAGKRRIDGLQVGAGAGDAGADLSVQKIGHGDRRQNTDDGDNDQQLNQGETTHFGNH